MYKRQINNNIIDIKNVLFSSYPRSILIEIDQDILPTDSIYVSYNGTSVRSTDNNLLSIFSEELVNNTISFIHTIPGKIEAEHFFFQKGMELENTSDEGEGFNVGSLDNGDYADYYVDVQLSGTYNVTYRVAADPSWSSGGQIELSIYDSNSNSFTFLQNIIIPCLLYTSPSPRD